MSPSPIGHKLGIGIFWYRGIGIFQNVYELGYFLGIKMVWCITGLLRLVFNGANLVGIPSYFLKYLPKEVV